MMYYWLKVQKINIDGLSEKLLYWKIPDWSIMVTYMRVKVIDNSKWNLARDWFWRQNVKEECYSGTSYSVTGRTAWKRGATLSAGKWSMVAPSQRSFSRKLKLENDNCPLIYYPRLCLCKQMNAEYSIRRTVDMPLYVSFPAFREDHLVGGWRVGRRRRTGVF